MADNPTNFWKELKRRRVIRVIIIYAAAAYVILELVSIIAEPFGLPDWTLKLVFVLLCIGLVVSIILSWIYDITPEGVKKTEPTKGKSDPATVKMDTSKGWRIATFASIVVILGLLLVNILTIKKRHSAEYDLEKSIAVLPFKSLSEDPEKQYLADGVMDAILLNLSQIEDLHVPARTSVEQYRETTKTAREIGKELNVSFILEATFQKYGDHVKLITQLIRTSNDSHVWSNDYNREWKDIFIVQSEVARTIANELYAKITPEEKRSIEKIPTKNLDAYDLYLLGRFHWNKRTKDGVNKSIEYFEQAISLDSGYAVAYAGLADAYYIAADWNYILPEYGFRKAKELANKALLLDKNSAESYATLAGIAGFLDFDTDKADSLFRKALTLNCNYASAYQWYSLHFTKRGQFDKAIINMNHALNLEPLSPIINFASGLVYYYAEKYDTALVYFNKTLELAPEFPSVRLMEFLCYFNKNLINEAIMEYPKSLKNKALVDDYNKRAFLIYENSGCVGYLDYLIELEKRKEHPSTRSLALLNALVGNKQEALDYIEYNIEERITEYQFIGVEPAFKDLNSEPRFKMLLEKVGL